MDRDTNTSMETKLKYFDAHGRPSQSEEIECMCAHDKDGVTRVTYPSKYFNFVSVCVFVCLSSVISSIFGKSFHFPFPYFVLFVLRYFPFHVVGDL